MSGVKNGALIVGGLLVGAAAWWWWRGRGNQAVAVDFGSIGDSVAAAVNDLTGIDIMNWQQVANRPENSQYVAWLHAAENANGIPANMLVRLAYQESRFRQDIISGRTVSAAGAKGIMQIVPRWHPTVDPLNPQAAINYAGRFLAGLKRQFGTWERALQAYNWGAGNLSKFIAGTIGSMPRETSNYSGQILADLRQIGSAVA